MTWGQMVLQNKKFFIISLFILVLISILIVFIIRRPPKELTQEETIKIQNEAEKEMAQTEEAFWKDPVNKMKQKLPYQTASFEISFFLDKDNKINFSITIYKDFAQSKKEAIQWIKNQGVDPQKINIVYFDRSKEMPPRQKEEEQIQKAMEVEYE